jgi:hypothetical protein
LVFFIETVIVSETERSSTVTASLTSFPSTLTSQSSTETTAETEMGTSLDINTSQSASTETISTSITQPAASTPSHMQTSTQQVLVTSLRTTATETGKILIVYY